MGDLMEDSIWFLEGLQESGKAWIIKLDQFPFLLGRSKDCQLTLSHTSVSREHTKIILQKNELFIEDCNSTNGTILNGRLLKQLTRLRDADNIKICNFEFRVTSKADNSQYDQTIISSSESPINSFSLKYKLTPREEELLSYLIKGVSTKEVASSMFISPGTAKNHILNLLKKTGTHSRLELITSYNKY